MTLYPALDTLWGAEMFVLTWGKSHDGTAVRQALTERMWGKLSSTWSSCCTMRP
jgi:hypothetical protein